ncbi:MAG TPA: DegV family protein [Candidatus Avidehalobacter gallistercoris]|uniref:DegV family protein n=1 Tax=Candidatus Avidehalobacter gallistercoris TaxID=2840694 RepID=A0A9D1HJK2_9FIRM|nr:DegV family protein [Candidatus Avidehalobacter gallistercoris]
MPKTGIVTDSNSGILPEQAEEMGLFVVPMPFYIDGVCYQENVDLPREEFFRLMAAGAEISTSAPAPLTVTDIWDKALAIYDEVLYMPMSSGLSGAYALAAVLAKEGAYAGRVFVVDHGRAATPLHRSILDAQELLAQGLSAGEVQRLLEEQRDNFMIYIAVDELQHLQRGGRISATAAKLGTILNMKPVLQFSTGTLDVYAKVRGKKRARQTMIEAVRNELAHDYKAAYEAGEVYIMTAGSADAAETADWVAQVREAFAPLDVLYDDLPLSLSTHIGHGGLGIACSKKIKLDK